MTARTISSGQAAKPTGYTVLRAGRHPELDVCLAVTHIGAPVGASLDAPANRLELDLGPARLLLAEIPSDVASLMVKAPERVLVITVDTLSQVKSSAALSDLMRAAH